MNFVTKLIISAKTTPIRKPPIDTTKKEANARPTCAALISAPSKPSIVRYKTTDAASGRSHAVNHLILDSCQKADKEKQG